MDEQEWVFGLCPAHEIDAALVKEFRFRKIEHPPKDGLIVFFVPSRYFENIISYEEFRDAIDNAKLLITYGTCIIGARNIKYYFDPEIKRIKETAVTNVCVGNDLSKDVGHFVSISVFQD